MQKLPDHVKAYKKTKVFDENSVPSGLLKDHRTLEGVWGKINILKGNLLYTIQSDPVEKVELDIDNFGVVEPGVTHFVSVSGGVSFYVEFYK